MLDGTDTPTALRCPSVSLPFFSSAKNRCGGKGDIATGTQTAWCVVWSANKFGSPDFHCDFKLFCPDSIRRNQHIYRLFCIVAANWSNHRDCRDAVTLLFSQYMDILSEKH